jgi:hypothetical protein
MRKSSFIVILSLTTYILGAPLSYPAAKDNHTPTTRCPFPESPFPNNEASVHPGIIPRGLEGTVVHLHPDGKPMTVGSALGRGCWGQVHHPSNAYHAEVDGVGLVAKQVGDQELHTLQTLDELAFKGQDKDGRTWALMQHHPGKAYDQTEHFRHAPDFHALRANAENQIGQVRLQIADKTGILHNDASLETGHALFGEPTDPEKGFDPPRLVGWKHTVAAPPKDHDGKFSAEDMAHIVGLDTCMLGRWWGKKN